MEDTDVLLDDLLAAITLVRRIIPMGTSLYTELSLAYEAIVEIRSIQAEISPDELQAALAAKLGAGLVEDLKDRFG